MPIYMNIDGIAGESTSRGHENWFDILSFSWGVSNTVRSTGTGGGGAGKAAFSDFSVMKRSGKGSPLLMLACANGRHLATITVDVTRSNGDGQEVILQHYTLTECIVTTFDTSGDGDTVPIESVSFNYGRIDFIEDLADGSSQEAFWDVRRNSGGSGGG